MKKNKGRFITEAIQYNKGRNVHFQVFEREDKMKRSLFNCEMETINKLIFTKLSNSGVENSFSLS